LPLQNIPRNFTRSRAWCFPPYGDNFMRSLRSGRWRGEKGRLRKLSRVSSWRWCFIDCDEMVRLYGLQQGTVSAQESSWLSACLNTVTFPTMWRYFLLRANNLTLYTHKIVSKCSNSNYFNEKLWPLHLYY